MFRGGLVGGGFGEKTPHPGNSGAVTTGSVGPGLGGLGFRFEV